jgi:hypothetical protein
LKVFLMEPSGPARNRSKSVQKHLSKAQKIRDAVLF